MLYLISRLYLGLDVAIVCHEMSSLWSCDLEGKSDLKILEGGMKGSCLKPDGLVD